MTVTTDLADSLTPMLQRIVREGVFTCCWCGVEFRKDRWAYLDEDVPGFVCDGCWQEAQP